MTEHPFNRQVELWVGPLPEWRGGGDPALAVRLFGDGTQNGLRIKFDIHKYVISTASPTVISIYNLGPGLRNALKRSGIQLALSIGWENVGLIPVFKGSVLTTVTYRQGPDIVTDIMSLAGYGGLSRSVITKAFSGGVRLKDMIYTIAQELQGVTTDPKLIDVSPVKFGNQGWSFAGLASEGLDKLARVYGFSWWIEKGLFHAVDDGRPLKGGSTPVLSGKNGFLLRAEPMLASPFQLKTGVSVTSLFNPYVEAGRSFRLESESNPDLNGNYKVHTLRHDGDTHSSQWQTSIQSWIVL